MTTLFGLSGSLRKGSYNAGLLRAAVEMMPEGARLETASIEGIPLYNADIEGSEGVPEAVERLCRPPEDRIRVFKSRAVEVIGASAGNHGTVFSQTARLPVLPTLAVRPWFGRMLYVSEAMKRCDASANLADETNRWRLKSHLEGFVAFVQQKN